MKQGVPFGRLFVEGIVIVLSILLAFAIDAYWAERVERQEEARILEQLDAELALYVRLLDVADRQVERATQAADVLLTAIHSEGDTQPGDLEEALKDLDRTYRLAAATATLDMLAGAGNMGLVSSPELRQALSDMISYIALVREFESNQVEFVENELMPYLSGHVDLYGTTERPDERLPPSRFETSYATLLSDRRFSNLLVRRKRIARLVSLFRNQLRESVSKAQIARNGQISEDST